jgi:hypothetical protein
MEEKLEITPDMIAEAKHNPNGWVYKIDWVYEFDQHVPPHAIVGAFKVDESGQLTGEFEPNQNYRPIKIANRKAREYMYEVAESQAKQPGYNGKEWVLETDPAYDHMFPDIPPEGLIGSWYIDSEGRFTGQFRPNPHYKGEIKT